MKVLITGKNSYIGTSVEAWMKQKNPSWSVDTIGTMEGEWENVNFADYDALFHVAGIAHVSSDPKLEELYYKVNRDLAIAIAKKAKSEGVKQFVFMSSIIVYGSGVDTITLDTKPAPDNFYGDSKLQADLGLHELQDDTFNVVSLRPPMIYGAGSKGNYPRLAKFAKSTPLFPSFSNKRSMLHIDNLCELVRLIIANNEAGYFYPQNKDYVTTSMMVKTIGAIQGKKVLLTKLFNPFIAFLVKRSSFVHKVFGSLVYEQSMSDYQNYAYCVRDFEESIILTEGVKK